MVPGLIPWHLVSTTLENVSRCVFWLLQNRNRDYTSVFEQRSSLPAARSGLHYCFAESCLVAGSGEHLTSFSPRARACTSIVWNVTHDHHPGECFRLCPSALVCPTDRPNKRLSSVENSLSFHSDQVVLFKTPRTRNLYILLLHKWVLVPQKWFRFLQDHHILPQGDGNG